MWRLYGGSALVLAGISAFIADARHKPLPSFEIIGSEGRHAVPTSGLSGTAYDLIHVGGWALIVAGVLLTIAGLIRYSEGRCVR